jgi:hypothetical protein
MAHADGRRALIANHQRPEPPGDLRWRNHLAIRPNPAKRRLRDNSGFAIFDVAATPRLAPASTGHNTAAQRRPLFAMPATSYR